MFLNGDEAVFPTILRKLRLEHRFTQSDMAKALNISRVAYTNYELGNREPDFATMICIAHILDTTVDYLLGNSTVGIQKNSASSAPPPQSDIDLSTPLRLIMLSAANLSSESYADLQKYIKLLKIKDGVANRSTHWRFMSPTTEHPGTGHDNNGDINMKQ